MIRIGLILFIVVFSTKLVSQQYEKDFQLLIQQEMGGEIEVAVTSGRVDLVTEEYAIEIEFASKWKQSIGQALWYALQTNKTPGIILIKKSDEEYKYVVQLGSALQYAGLNDRIKVWVYPDDFKNTTIVVPQSYDASGASLKKEINTSQYWKSKYSDKRHNSLCRYFENSNGEYCNAKDGIACALCGG